MNRSHLSRSACALQALVLLALVLPGLRARAADDLTFDTIGTGAGLPHQNVTSIVQDPQGYVWFGTASGLARYDGNQFRVFGSDSSDPNSLSERFVQTLSVDRDGNLWVGTLGGLNRYLRQADRWQRYSLDDALTPARARKMVWQILDNPECRGTDHTLWVATSDGLKQLAYDTGRVVTFRHDPNDPASLAADRVYALASDAQCRVWVGTGKAVQYLERGSTRFAAFPAALAAQDPAGRVEALFVDESQTLWIGKTRERSAWDVSGPSLAQPRRWFQQPAAAAQAALRFTEDRRHRIWVATSHGLQLWNREQGVVRSYTPQAQDAHAMPSESTKWVYVGHDDTLWVGTFDAGAVHSDLGTAGFLRYRHRDDDPTSLAGDITLYIRGEANGDTLWIGSPHGVSRLDRRSGRATRFQHDPNDPRSLADDNIGGIAIDASNTVWIASEGGIDAFEPATQTFRHLPLTQRLTSVNTLACDAAGGLWLATNSGVFFIDPASGKVTPVAMDGSGGGVGARTPSLLFDGSVFWFGTETSLIRYDLATQRSTYFQHQDGVPGTLSNSRIAGMLRDSAGRLWIGTSGGGLNRLDPQADGSVRFRAYTQRDGLLSDTIGQLLEDGQGRLWISSTLGLSVFDPANESFRNFTARDGLTENGYFIGAAYAAADGTLYFGGVRGMTAFRPDDVVTNTSLPIAAINGVDVLDRSRAESERFDPNAVPRGLDLPYTTAVLTFDLAALHFADPSRNRLRYRLEGFDTVWHARDAGQHKVTYTNLDPGEYTLRVQAASKDAIWSEPVAFALRIHPPFWQTAWFRVLALAFVLLGATLAYRLRTAGLMARQRVLEGEVAARTAELRKASQHKSEFLASMSHEIRTPMNAVIGLVHLSLREREMSERVRSYLGKIYVSAVALLRIIDDILDSSKIEAGRLEVERVGFLLGDVISHVLTVTEEKAAERGLALRVEIAPQVPRELVGDPLRLGQVLINLINNAVKFTERGEVALRCELVGSEELTIWLRWSVSDTGIGMTPEHLAKLFRPFVQADASISRKYGGSGLGLSISQRLVQLMGGHLEAESAAAIGTTFRFTLPFERAPPGAVRSASAAAEAPARDYAGARVLLVEDNAINRLIATELLTGSGIAVEAVDCGEAALSAVREHAPAHYAAVLMDLQMPGMDGFETTRAIRALPAGGDVAVIALTAHAAPEIQRRCAQAGMQECLGKPFHPAQLFAVLDRFIATRADLAPPAPATPGAAAVAEMPLFDPQRGLACTAGNALLYATVLQRFQAQTPDALRELARALRGAETALASRIVHTLRGLAATIGAQRLADCAAQLEAHLDQSEWDAVAVRRLADELATLALLTAPEIAEYLERLPAAAPEPATAMELDRGEYLAILRELLASGSGRTTQWAAQGRDLLRAELGAERAQRFEREVAAYAFSAALRVLDEDA